MFPVVLAGSPNRESQSLLGHTSTIQSKVGGEGEEKNLFYMDGYEALLLRNTVSTCDYTYIRRGSETGEEIGLWRNAGT